MSHAHEVQRVYGAAAQTSRAACCTPAGYSADELAAIPQDAHLSLGTGNPVRAAALRPGEVVVDLGSGGGIDVLLAARAVGPTGKAYGIDFTPEMLSRARRAAAEGGFENVEFLEAPIERLPLPDASADVVISNCVINLSADKPAVLREAARVLKPGGRFVVSDTLRLPGFAPTAPTCDCVGGALSASEWKRSLKEAGFVEPDVRVEPLAQDGCCVTDSTTRAIVRATRP